MGHTLTTVVKGEHAFERDGDYIRDKKTRKKVAYAPRKPSTQTQKPVPGASGQPQPVKGASGQPQSVMPNAGGSQQPAAQFGTRIGGSNRTVNGLQTDQPQFFGQGSNRSGGAGMPGLNPNAFNHPRSVQGGSVQTIIMGSGAQSG
ncbi:hypothetical protein SLS60_003032 [Paraconiothyrium brasiliense]|uniref:Uncharacterized protein n=1 Tax=Paraconiothyrium brasiliense TaxID=300254 RepID=A0ABR3RUI2_9PLEO